MGKSKLDSIEGYNIFTKKPDKDVKLHKYITPQVKAVKVSCPFGTTGQLEREVVKECKEYMDKELKLFSRKIYTGGVMVGTAMAANEASGIPDRLAFDTKNTRLIWIEFKRNTGGTISVDQQNWISWLEQCGQKVLVICSLPQLKYELRKLGLK